MREKIFSGSLFKVIFVVLLLIGLLCAATIFAPSLRVQAARLLHLPTPSVKGASTQLPDAMKKDLEKQAMDAKNKALHINVSDVIGFFARTRKIVDDGKHVASAAAKQLNNMLPHR